MEFQIKTKRDLFLALREKEEHSEQVDHLFSFLEESAGLGEELSDSKKTDLKRYVRRFTSKVNDRWRKSRREMERFLVNNEEWLDSSVDQLPACFKKNSRSSSGTGRPLKAFEDSSDRTKRRRSADTCQGTSTGELAYAMRHNLRAEGQETAARLVDEAFNTTPTRPYKIAKAWNKADSGDLRSLTEDEALSLFVEAKLSKHQYELIRKSSKSCNAAIFPSYDKILAAKQRCYPSKNTITVTESGAEVKLQALLDHTVQRIVTSQEHLLPNMTPEKNLTLISKCGFDGSSGHSNFKHKAPHEDFTSSDLFCMSIVPLRLYLPASETTVWENPRPSSPRYCRPIKFLFTKETANLAVQEKANIDQEIENLQPYIITENFSVSHQLAPTMVDGKVVSALTGIPSQTCNVCKATPRQMNDIDRLLLRPVNAEVFVYGLSTLHAWIRSFEYLLHVSYRLDIKKWQKKTPEDKKSVEDRKKSILGRFRVETGLVVDTPKQGSGSTNDGNTARRFFANPASSSSITGIDEDLIRRFAVILTAMASKRAINVEAFEEYALATARKCVELYGWYHMPASIHKVLLHGSAIIAAAPLPIGVLSEEPQESRNKDCRRYRENNTRKMSLQMANEDLMNMLLISSDPAISSRRKLPKTKTIGLPPEILPLLLPSATDSSLFTDSDKSEMLE